MTLSANSDYCTTHLSNSRDMYFTEKDREFIQNWEMVLCMCTNPNVTPPRSLGKLIPSQFKLYLPSISDLIHRKMLGLEVCSQTGLKNRYRFLIKVAFNFRHLNWHKSSSDCEHCRTSHTPLFLTFYEFWLNKKSFFFLFFSLFGIL